jgi:uncharacterized protein (TIGR00251 family)
MKIKIKVKPNCREQDVEKKEEYYAVKLKSPPENNKANMELLKVLKKYFNCSEVKIKSGFSSRNKIVEIYS